MKLWEDGLTFWIGSEPELRKSIIPQLPSRDSHLDNYMHIHDLYAQRAPTVGQSLTRCSVKFYCIKYAKKVFENGKYSETNKMGNPRPNFSHFGYASSQLLEASSSLKKSSTAASGHQIGF